MRQIVCCAVVLTLAVAGVAAAQDMSPSGHVVAAPMDLEWGPAPPIFEPGSSIAVVAGNPFAAGPYVVRLRMPAGYKIAPHWHPTDENVTVISGTFAVGMGETWDDGSLHELPPGGFVLLPAEMRHYAMSVTEGEVQVHGMGPFQLTYVNAADDPTQR
jgi:quercetin dioxygenase-like cupin family protein